VVKDVSLAGRGGAARVRAFWTAGTVAALALVIGTLIYPTLRRNGRVGAVARLAREAVADRREAEARLLIDRWDALGPRGGEPEYYRALVEVQADRPAEALDAIRRSMSGGYPERPLEILRAILMARAGRFDEAEPILVRAYRDSAEPRAEVAEGLSRIYLKTFRLAESIPVLDAWMKAAPADPRPYLRRNEVEERTSSETDLLIRNYREALRRAPGSIEARLGLADRLREAGLVDQAEVEYAKLLENDPRNVEGLVGAGRVALTRGDIPTSSRHFEAALALDPRQIVALRAIGSIDLHAGRIAQACARLGAAVEIAPFDPEIRYGYAKALRLAGDIARATREDVATERLKGQQQRFDALREQLTQQPGDVALRAEAARWLIENGHEKEGLEWTGLILRQHPGHRPTCLLLAEYHARRGDHGLANYYGLAANP